MAKKRVLGLDTGSNSLGWAIVDREESGEQTLVDKGTQSIATPILPTQTAQDRSAQGACQAQSVSSIDRRESEAVAYAQDLSQKR